MSKFNSDLPNSNSDLFRKEPYFIDDSQSLDLEHFVIPRHYQEHLKSVMVPHGMIVDRVEKLAGDISHDYNGHTIHLLCVLKGSFLFDFRSD
jgi:hypoxanthine phosphoribosyltransferase